MPVMIFQKLKKLIWWAKPEETAVKRTNRESKVMRHCTEVADQLVGSVRLESSLEK